METVNVNFTGPFSFRDPQNSVFTAPCAGEAGVYLWTIKQCSDFTHMVHYIGETTSLAKRHREHLVNILGLSHGIFDPDKAQQGVSERIWSGLWRDKSPEGPGKQMAAYQAIHASVIKYVSILTIFFAPLRVETQLRKHIEGCIAKNLRNNHSADTALYPADNHVGTMSEKNRGKLMTTAPEIICGQEKRSTKIVELGDLMITAPEIIRGLDERIPY